MHRNSRLLFEKYARNYFCPGFRVLEIGPDKLPSTYQSLVSDNSLQWETLDLRPDKALTYVAPSEYSFPIPDGTFDLVLSGQVIEHVRKPWRWIREVSRVCRAGGHVITINPVSWPYHEAPVDCWRAFPEGMRALYEDAGLEVVLSQWECLEVSSLRPRLPGRSREWQPFALRSAFTVLGMLGFPVECAFDTITVGRKPTPPAIQ
jgi:SAM-dependent methyltransferase